MDNPCIKCIMSQSEKAACCGCQNVFKWEREQKEKRKKKEACIGSLGFLNFLFNTINPNEMEQYISMYLASGEKVD